jgi:hypothetical protein
MRLLYRKILGFAFHCESLRSNFSQLRLPAQLVTEDFARNSATKANVGTDCGVAMDTKDLCCRFTNGHTHPIHLLVYAQSISAFVQFDHLISSSSRGQSPVSIYSELCKSDVLHFLLLVHLINQANRLVIGFDPFFSLVCLQAIPCMLLWTVTIDNVHHG